MSTETATSTSSAETAPNAAGALVKELYTGHRTAGVYEAGWNGDNTQGQKVASGIYFYKLSATDFTQTKKMILLK